MKKGIVVAIPVAVIGLIAGLWLTKKENSAENRPYTTFGISTDGNPNVNPKLKKEEPKPVVKETERDIIKRISDLAQTPSFKMLKKNPDKYKDIDAIYQGLVVDTHEYDGATYFRLLVTKNGYGQWDDENFLMIRYEGKVNIVDEDIVKVYGHIRGRFDYESTANWKITCPALMAEVITIVKNPNKKSIGQAYRNAKDREYNKNSFDVNNGVG